MSQFQTTEVDESLKAVSFSRGKVCHFRELFLGTNNYVSKDSAMKEIANFFETLPKSVVASEN